MTEAAPQEMLNALTQALIANDWPDNVQRVTKATEILSPEWDAPDNVNLEIEYINTNGENDYIILNDITLEYMLRHHGVTVPRHQLTWQIVEDPDWVPERRYTVHTAWSEADSQHVGLAPAFPSLSWLADTELAALQGIHQLVQDAIRDMGSRGEALPEEK